MPTYRVNDEPRKPFLTMPESRVGKVGCWFLIVLWSLILLTPCALFLIAAQGDLTLYHRDVPEPDTHPYLQIRLISDASNTGLQVVRSVILPGDERICVETYVNYLLWQSDSNSDQNTTFCDCYLRDDEQYTFDSSSASACLR